MTKSAMIAPLDTFDELRDQLIRIVAISFRYTESTKERINYLEARNAELLEALQTLQMATLGYTDRNAMVQSALEKSVTAIAKAKGDA